MMSFWILPPRNFRIENWSQEPAPFSRLQTSLIGIGCCQFQRRDTCRLWNRMGGYRLNSSHSYLSIRRQTSLKGMGLNSLFRHILFDIQICKILFRECIFRRHRCIQGRSKWSMCNKDVFSYFLYGAFLHLGLFCSHKILIPHYF